VALLLAYLLLARVLTKGCPTLRCSGPCRYASNPLLELAGPEEDDVSGVSPEDLAETDLIRELEHLGCSRVTDICAP
jgi:hypothetical protein